MTGPRSVVLLNPCGWGNLGDAAILAACIEAVRSRWPGAAIRALTLRPSDTTARHGIPASPLASYSLRDYGVEGQPGAWGLRTAALAAGRELLARRRSAATLAECDLLVVAGGGQLDDYWGGPWGHPYALWKWTGVARRGGVPVVVLSVGFGTARSRLSRRFVRGALHRAAYCSVRDEGSRRLVAALDAELPLAVAPDLAFGIVPRPPTRGTVAGGRIGVSPMAFADPRVWPERDAARYGRYLERLAAVVRGLARAGREVHLFSTDRPDRHAVRELAALAGGAEGGVVAHDTTTVAATLELLATLDLVVASRLHGVILALAAGCPVAAVSYERKVDQVMADLALERFAIPIDACEPAAALALVERLWAERAAVAAAVAPRVADYREQLARQYARAFACARAGS